MAAAGIPVQDLCEEATCSICLEYFRDPVTIAECGHDFCRACLTQYLGQLDNKASCPQCRVTVQQRPVSNRKLANFVEITKRLSLQGEKGSEGKGRVCERHQEPLKLFCKDDETLICVVCDRSKEHRDHKIFPLEEASEGYKSRIYTCLEFLRKERENIRAFRDDTLKENQELLKQTKSAKEDTVAEFRRLRQFLEIQEKLLLAQMEEVEKEIARRREEHLARLSQELSSLNSIIQEMEVKRQQPVSDLLKDIRSFLQRCEKEKFENPVAFPPELKWRIWDFCDQKTLLEGVVKQFRDTLVSGLQLQKANITLDPDTAHPQLILSEDRKRVRVGGLRQDLPNNPERFDSWLCVLGHEGFTAGRHFWDVVVGSEERWAVGVARTSVKRRDFIILNEMAGVWVVGKWGGQYIAPKPGGNVALALGAEPKKIRIILNSAVGQVCFYDADTAAQIYVFPVASFSRETLQPFFYVANNAHLTLSP